MYLEEKTFYGFRSCRLVCLQTCEHENDNYLCTDISLRCFYQMFLQQKKV